jgi:hypothetical protein
MPLTPERERASNYSDTADAPGHGLMTGDTDVIIPANMSFKVHGTHITQSGQRTITGPSTAHPVTAVAEEARCHCLQAIDALAHDTRRFAAHSRGMPARFRVRTC